MRTVASSSLNPKNEFQKANLRPVDWRILTLSIKLFGLKKWGIPAF